MNDNNESMKAQEMKQEDQKQYDRLQAEKQEQERRHTEEDRKREDDARQDEARRQTEIKAHDEKRRQERTDKEQKEAEEARLNEQRMKDMHEATVKTLHEDRGELRTEGQGGAWVDGNAIVADYYKNYDPAAQRIQHMDSTERAEYQESLKGQQERQPSLEKPQSESKGQTQDKGQNLSPAMQKLQERFNPIILEYSLYFKPYCSIALYFITMSRQTVGHWSAKPCCEIH